MPLLLSDADLAAAAARRPQTMPLAGLRVIDAGQIIAGPFGPSLLADFGADVIKIEDPALAGRELAPTVALGRAVESRNKRSITLDMRTPRGQDLLRRLAGVADVLVENYTPGTMEKWGLGPEDLFAFNPRLVYVRVSGYGQTGPYRRKGGYDRVAMAVGGLLHVTGEKEGAPVHPGYMLADHLAGTFNALGALMALYWRDAMGGQVGQVVDVSLYEPMFRLSHNIAGEYGHSGKVRQRAGNTRTWTVPGEQFRTADSKWVLIIAPSDRLFIRLCLAMGRPELAADPRFSEVHIRQQHADEVHAEIRAWVRNLTIAEVIATLDDAQVPVGPIYSIEEIFADPHYEARGDIVEIPDLNLGRAAMPGVIPKLSRTPGAIYRSAPRTGGDNDSVFGDLLALTAGEIEDLRSAKVI
jgi:crotonobetainyl-CoA:carnitine CoA-transferase CaiB-like acyl-CoA transferase